MSSTDPNSLYVRRVGRISGPHDWRSLQTMAKRGALSRFHEVSADGDQWVTAAEHPGLFDATAPVQAEAAATQVEQTTSTTVSQPETGGDWHYEANDEPMGPVPFETLQGLVSTGTVPLTARVWTKGMPDWAAADTIPDLKAVGPAI
jgi:hypothetical protein